MLPERDDCTEVHIPDNCYPCGTFTYNRINLHVKLVHGDDSIAPGKGWVTGNRGSELRRVEQDRAISFFLARWTSDTAWSKPRKVLTAPWSVMEKCCCIVYARESFDELFVFTIFVTKETGTFMFMALNQRGEDLSDLQCITFSPLMPRCHESLPSLMRVAHDIMYHCGIVGSHGRSSQPSIFSACVQCRCSPDKDGAVIQPQCQAGTKTGTGGRMHAERMSDTGRRWTAADLHQVQIAIVSRLMMHWQGIQVRNCLGTL
eukprot:6484468-Amphidinium_carterae.1